MSTNSVQRQTKNKANAAKKNCKNKTQKKIVEIR